LQATQRPRKWGDIPLSVKEVMSGPGGMSAAEWEVCPLRLGLPSRGEFSMSILAGGSSATVLMLRISILCSRVPLSVLVRVAIVASLTRCVAAQMEVGFEGWRQDYTRLAKQWWG
jgi:hypothetical protein